MNTTSTPEEEKLIDIAPHEDRLRVPLHEQDPCRFCGRTGILSEGLLKFHRDKKQENDHWKSPTSCPECRPLSAANAASRRSNCPSSKVEFESKAEAEKYERLNREKHNSAEQYVYYCAKCHNYHLTTTSQRTHPPVRFRLLWEEPQQACPRTCASSHASRASISRRVKGTGSVPHVPRRRPHSRYRIKSARFFAHDLPLA